MIGFFSPLDIMKKRHLFLSAICLGLGMTAFWNAAAQEPVLEPMATGKFQPTWESLGQYKIPEWFRDAKFGIWAHWGPQCEPEAGDWYARNMYFQKDGKYRFHLAHYGHPSEFGFKDVINFWKAEKWDPEKLLALYKGAGVQYFMALANHHDNFDNWDSKYQLWNSVCVGPHKDLIAGWAKAARDNGLKFGVSVHAARAWSWYEPAQGADKEGPLAGVPYDGKLTKADGKGKWWDGLDPQDLYAQNHTPGKKMVWDWDAKKGSSVPDQAYCDKFYNRTVDLINKYKPDLIYFDDHVLPLWPVSDVGLKLAAHFYNSNNQWHGADDDGVLFGKILNEQQRHCMVLDIERGESSKIEPLPWQTDTCLGDWHYDRSYFNGHYYRSAKTVIRTLADVVSKNGNLLLSVPVRADGTIDGDETKIVEEIAQWMDVNRECIFGTRPWKVFGEGTAGKQGTVRFTTKGNTLYVIAFGWPNTDLQIKSLGTNAKLYDGRISDVTLLGSDEKMQWSQDAEALTIKPPQKKIGDSAIVFKITPSS